MIDGNRSVRLRLAREHVHCGKKTCRVCAAGKGHGPYYYLYGLRNGRRSKAYLGLKLRWPFTLFDVS